MDKHSRGVELDEGVVRISGGTTPGAFPHLCPFQPKGATREFCTDTTSNLQRNKAGCFGTTDHRNIGSCNSALRKCVVCLIRSEGKLKRPVVDLKRGLCDVHCAEAEAPPPPKPIPTRSVHFAPILATKRRIEEDRPESKVWTRPAESSVKPAVEPTPSPKIEKRELIPRTSTPLAAPSGEGAGSPFSGVRTVRARMDRKEKIAKLKNLADQLREEKLTVNILLMVKRAIKKDGPLEGKTTAGSLRVFLYTLEPEEKTSIGL